MLINDSPLPSDPAFIHFAHWLDQRLPVKAIYNFPFDKAVEAFTAGRIIKLSVKPIGKRKHSVELWIDE